MFTNLIDTIKTKLSSFAALWMPSKRTAVMFSDEDIARMSSMSADSVQRSMNRRIAAAVEDAPRRRKMRRISVAVLVLTVAVMSAVVGIAATKPVPAEPDIQTVVIYGHRDTWFVADADMRLVEMAVEGTAGNQSQLCKMAVAECIRNTCEQKNMTVAEAIDSGRFAVNGEAASQDTVEAISAIVNGITLDSSMMYCWNDQNGRNAFHETLTPVAQYGDMTFYKAEIN